MELGCTPTKIVRGIKQKAYFSLPVDGCTPTKIVKGIKRNP